MKRLRFRLRPLLWVLLALAPAAMLDAWLRLHRPASRVMAMPARIVRTNDTESKLTPAAGQTGVGSPKQAGGEPDDGTPWSALQKHRYEEAIRRLRAVGCPEETIRDLILMRLTRRAYDDVLDGVRVEASSRPWWRSNNDLVNRFTKAAQAARPRMRAEAELVLGKPWKELLAEYFPAYGTLPPDFLPSSQRKALSQLEAQLQERLQEIRGKAGSAGLIDAGLRAEMRQARQEHRGEVERLLNPAELSDYDARESAAGNFVLGNLPEAQSEAEFRAMVKAAQGTGIDFQEVFEPDVSDMDGWQKQRAQAAQAVREAFLKSASPERADEIARLEAERESREQEAEAERQREQESRNEAEMRQQLEDAAREAGATTEGATRFIEALKARKDEWQAREKEMARQPGGRTKFEKEFRAMMDTLATEHFGEHGPEVLKKLPGWKAE